jgi:hypothetical protein
LSRTRSDASSRSNCIQSESAHRGRGVELLGDRHERDRPGIKGFDQLGKVSERSGDAVDLVDDDHLDPAEFDFSEEAFQGGAFEIAAGVGGVVIVLGQCLPALRGLTPYIGLAGLALSVQGIELLVEAVLGRLAGVDGAADGFSPIVWARGPSRAGRATYIGDPLNAQLVSLAGRP